MNHPSEIFRTFDFTKKKAFQNSVKLQLSTYQEKKSVKMNDYLTFTEK